MLLFNSNSVIPVDTLKGIRRGDELISGSLELAIDLRALFHEFLGLRRHASGQGLILR